MLEPVQLVVAVCVCIFNEAIAETVSLQMGGLCEEEIEGGCGRNGIGGGNEWSDIGGVSDTIEGGCDLFLYEWVLAFVLFFCGSF